jgi:hypothetical protein
MTHVKWLTDIEAIDRPFEGYQQTPSYHYTTDADDVGTPVDRIRVRALLIPPGIPEFFSRTRTLDAGTVRIIGRAWSGEGTVDRVEVGIDDAWTDAVLEPPVGPFAWRGWHLDWLATPGSHELSCRAADSGGNVQPLEQPWTYQGMGNNLVQTVDVTVR